MEGTGITLKKECSRMRFTPRFAHGAGKGAWAELEPTSRWGMGRPPSWSHAGCSHPRPSRAAMMRSGTAARLPPRPSKRQLPGGKPSEHHFIFPLQGREPGLVKTPNVNYPTKPRHSPTVRSMLISKAKNYYKPWLTRLQNLPNSSEVCFG